MESEYRKGYVYIQNHFSELLQKLKKGIFLLMTRIIWTEKMQWQ